MTITPTLPSQIGPYSIRLHNFGNFRLDGGSMFGAVPKVLWSKLITPDDRNRILLATNSLVLKSSDRTILIDCGMGNKWNDKLKDIYAIEPFQELPEKQQVTDVILTHLHFDHAGGVSEVQNGQLQLTYPQATHYLQRSNYELAQNPNVREAASYLKENVEPLKQGKLQLLDGDSEILPNIKVIQINGHTRGQQIVQIFDDQQSIYFLSDLAPTRHHLAINYHMGYDMHTELLIEEKLRILNEIKHSKALICLQHDHANSIYNF